MNPQVTLALLAKYTSLSNEDAKELAKALGLATQPTDYQDAVALVAKMVSEIKKK